MWRLGKQHGLETGWDVNGQKKWQEIYKRGKVLGVRTWWFRNGERKEEIYYIGGKVYARIKWDDEGNVIEVDFPSQSNNKSEPKIQKKITLKRK